MVCVLLNVFALTDSAVYCNENKPTHSLCIICIVNEKKLFFYSPARLQSWIGLNLFIYLNSKFIQIYQINLVNKSIKAASKTKIDT